ncbi:MAG: hypothetical protein ABIR84_09245 [Candidatus Nitrotoga sp.]
MANKFNTEQVRAETHREASERWIELEQKRLNDIFAKLGGIEHTLPSLNFPQSDEFSTLDKVRSSVEAGNKKAMLALLAISTDALRAYEVLPQKVREALADGLEKMRKNMEESKGFLPRKRGQKSADSREEFTTAINIEFIRDFKGESLINAIADVAEESGLTESLVHKRWKRHHEGARGALDAMSSGLDVASNVTGIPNRMLRAKKKRAMERRR